MTIKVQLTADMKAAMKARDKTRLSTIRMTLAAIKQREIDDQTTLDDSQVLAVVEKLIKQRRESASQFRDGDREELALKEEAEAEVLGAYLPKQLSDDELNAAVDAAISATGASSMREMGAVMAALKDKLAGRAEMSRVSAAVKARLG